MILRRYVSMASTACGVTLALAGPVMAADVSMDTTGSGSNQSVVINNSSNVSATNTNVAVVKNENVQQATTGNIAANSNTSIGSSVQSGNASNANSTTTTVFVSNELPTALPVGGAGNGNGAGVGNGSGQTNGSPASVAVPGKGKVLGAATVGGLGGGAVLPAVGASVPVDVSVMRAAWHPQIQTPTAALAKGSTMFTRVMLITAALLSLLGAMGSAWYARRREERV